MIYAIPIVAVIATFLFAITVLALMAIKAEIKNKRLLDEIERLNNLMANPHLLDLAAEEGAIELNMKCPHWAVKGMCMSLADSLNGAKNFATIDLGTPEFGLFEVTIRRQNGKTPAQAIDELRDLIRRFKDYALMDLAVPHIPLQNRVEAYQQLISEAYDLLSPTPNQEPASNGNA